MAHFLPVKFKFKEERYHQMKVKNGVLTAKDIISCVGEPYQHYILMSGDYMYYNVANREENKDRNDIASSILGIDVFGPVLIATIDEVIGEN